MNPKTFQELFKNHRQKLSSAFIKLSDKDWEAIGGDLKRFLEKTAKVYNIPEKTILKELSAVKKNIGEGIETDYVPYLDPIE